MKKRKLLSQAVVDKISNPYEFAKVASVEQIGSRIEHAETDAVYWKMKYEGTWVQGDEPHPPVHRPF